jgi:hypothetical protein
MGEVQSGNKQKGNPDEKEVMVVEKSAGVPGNHKDAACNANGEDFSKAVIKQVTVKTGQV